jgi:hypothetical protein
MRSKRKVHGFHFVCPTHVEVRDNGDGTMSTGIWVVDIALAEDAQRIGAYVALHRAKSERSYCQGPIRQARKLRRNPLKVDGRETKARYGVEFTFEPHDRPLLWRGGGTGEKGYYYGEDATPTE